MNPSDCLADLKQPKKQKLDKYETFFFQSSYNHDWSKKHYVC
jgi:hypothetical protein